MGQDCSVNTVRETGAGFVKGTLVVSEMLTGIALSEGQQYLILRNTQIARQPRT